MAVVESLPERIIHTSVLGLSWGRWGVGGSLGWVTMFSVKGQFCRVLGVVWKKDCGQVSFELLNYTKLKEVFTLKKLLLRSLWMMVAWVIPQEKSALERDGRWVTAASQGVWPIPLSSLKDSWKNTAMKVAPRRKNEFKNIAAQSHTLSLPPPTSASGFWVGAPLRACPPAPRWQLQGQSWDLGGRWLWDSIPSLSPSSTVTSDELFILYTSISVSME